MKLITEVVEDVQYVIEEGAGGKKNLYIEGIFLQANVKNRNGRVYPTGILENEVRRYNDAYVNESRAFGELGHPNGPSINLDRVSHIIKELRQDGSNFIGKAQITDTPYGNIARGIIESGGKLGVSSRGMGTLKVNKQGINEVQGDFHLATAADIVSDPSAPDAFVNGIMEGVDWIWENDILVAKRAQDAVEASVRSKALEEHKLKIFSNYLVDLQNSTKLNFNK